MDNRITETIAANVDEYRKSNRMTKRVLADALGMNYNSLRNKMCGKSEWKWSEIMTLAEMTRMTRDEHAGKCTGSETQPTGGMAHPLSPCRLPGGFPPEP